MGASGNDLRRDRPIDWGVRKVQIHARTLPLLSDPFRVQNRPPLLGPSWYEAHNELTGLGAGAIVLVIGSLVVAVVDARWRG